MDVPLPHPGKPNARNHLTGRLDQTQNDRVQSDDVLHNKVHFYKSIFILFKQYERDTFSSLVKFSNNDSEILFTIV